MRLIDADELKKIRDEVIQGRIKFNGNEYDLIDKCPTVDAVPVVRCRDCKYRTEYGNCGHQRHEDTLPTAYPNDFCSYGERKEGAD